MDNQILIVYIKFKILLIIHSKLSNNTAKRIISTKLEAPVMDYMPMKSHKWGIEVQAGCEISGLFSGFDIYLGKQSDTGICK